MENIIPYNPTFELGNGFDTVKGKSLGTIFQPGFGQSETIGAHGQEVHFRMSRIDAVEQMYEALGISMEASGRYGLFAASAKFEYAQASSFNSFSVFYLLSVKVRNAVKHIKDQRVLPEVAQLLTDGKADRFMRGFGDSFIEGIITGGEFFAIYEFVCTDESSRTQIGAQLETEYGVALFSGAEVSAKFNSVVSSASRRSQLKLTTSQSGGVGQDVVTNPEEMLARAKGFPAIVQGENGVAYEAIIKSYETLPLPEGPNYIELENKAFVLDSYAKDIVRWRQTLTELDYIIKNPEEFEFQDEGQMKTVVQQRDAVGRIINAYTRHAAACADSVSACEVFNPAANDALAAAARLPTRKRTLDFAVIYDGVNYTGNAHYLTKGKYKDGSKELGVGNDKVESVKIPSGWQVTLFEHWFFNGRNLPLTESCADLSRFGFSDLTSSMFVGEIGETVVAEQPPVAPVAPVAPAVPGVGPKAIGRASSATTRLNTLALAAFRR